jgi:hypothetical protein
MLCGLGTAVLAAVPARSWSTLGFLPLSFAATVLLIGPDRSPDSSRIASLVAIFGLLDLFRPRRDVWAAVGAGVSAGVWSVLLQLQGLPAVPSLIVAASLPGLSAYFATRRRAFASAQVRDEALVGVIALGLTTAVIPGVLAGWRSAIALNLEGGGDVNQMVPVWVLLVTGASVALGGLYSVWVRRTY